MRLLFFLAVAVLVGASAEAAQVDDATAVAMAKPQELIVAGDIKPKALVILLAPVDAFYGFWINGS
jgi:hypothetical protein